MPITKLNRLSAILLGLVLVFSACQNVSRIERVIPENALAVVPYSTTTDQFPFPGLIWHKVLLPFSKKETGIVYLGKSSKEISIEPKKGFITTALTQLRGVEIVHFRYGKDNDWVFAQMDGMMCLSTRASLVEEVVLGFKNSRHADWVKPLHPREIQFNYPVLSRFMGWEEEASRVAFKSIRLKPGQHQGQWSGSVDFMTTPSTPEYSLAPILSIIPEEANSITPIWSPGKATQWLKQFSAQTGYSVHFASMDLRESACILPFANPEAANNALNTIVNKYGALPNHTYQTYTIHSVLDLGLSELDIHAAALVVVGNNLVMASSVNLLERWIDALLVGNTVSQHLRHAPRGLWMRMNKEEGLGQALSVLDQHLQLGLGLTSIVQLEGEVSHNSWRFKRTQSTQTTTQTPTLLWQTDLSADGVVQSIGLEKWQSWAIETIDHRLVCWDKSGKMRWAKKLEGPMIGKAIECAWLGQHQSHLFFATATAIHALQADGSELPGFPWMLKIPTTSGICIGGRDQYLFYASEDGRIYGLDAQGTPLSGWNPGPKIGRILQPLSFFQSATADYLLVLTEDGQLHALNRAGLPHFASIHVAGPFQSAPQWQWDQFSQRIVVADGQGKAQAINAKGEVFSLPLTPGQPGETQLCLVELAGDARKDYLSASGPHLFLHSYGSAGYRLIFEQHFDAPIGAISVHRQGQNALILLSVPLRHEVWALNTKGDALSGFPVAGDQYALLPKSGLLVTIVDDRAYGWGMK